MKHLLLIALTFAPTTALAEFTLSDLTGTWTGNGTYHEGLSSAKMKCKLTGAAQGESVRMTGRCASSLGSQKVDMIFTPQSNGAILLSSGPNAPKVETAIDTVLGTISGEQLFLTGQADKETIQMQFVNKADGKLYFATERVWHQGKNHSKITLSRR